MNFRILWQVEYDTRSSSFASFRSQYRRETAILLLALLSSRFSRQVRISWTSKESSDLAEV